MEIASLHPAEINRRQHHRRIELHPLIDDHHRRHGNDRRFPDDSGPYETHVTWIQRGLMVLLVVMLVATIASHRSSSVPTLAQGPENSWAPQAYYHWDGYHRMTADS